jgi:hypothetical protein|nr:MAG TPA: hypothetical protein [Caudoviricetes sp.]
MGVFLTVKGTLIDDHILAEDYGRLELTVYGISEIYGYFHLYSKNNNGKWGLLGYVKC